MGPLVQPLVGKIWSHGCWYWEEELINWISPLCLEGKSVGKLVGKQRLPCLPVAKLHVNSTMNYRPVIVDPPNIGIFECQ